MDLVTLAMAKQYTDSKQLGHKETYRFSGHRDFSENPDAVFMEMPAYRLTTVCPLKEEIPSMQWGDGSNTYPVTAMPEIWFDLGPVVIGGLVLDDMVTTPLSCLFVYESGTHTVTMPAELGGETMEIDAPAVGLYIVPSMGSAITYDITWTHVEQIDKDLIPGVVLPMVSLVTGVKVFEPTTLREEDCAVLTENIGKPIAASMTLMQSSNVMGKLCGVFTYMENNVGEHTFTAFVNNGECKFVSADGVTWTAEFGV